MKTKYQKYPNFLFIQEFFTFIYHRVLSYIFIYNSLTELTVFRYTC